MQSCQLTEPAKHLNRIRFGGFTLVEVLTVVLIMGILAAVAIPNYRDYIRRAQSSEAPAVLLEGRAKMEQYFLDNRQYISSGTNCGAFVNRTENHFAYTCTASTATSYSIEAVGIAASSVNLDKYTVDQSNTRRTIKFQGVDYSSTPKTCWLIKGTEC